MVRSTLTRSLNISLFLMVLNIKQPVLTLQSKIVLLKEKNRHLLEVARSLMFIMNVPKFIFFFGGGGGSEDCYISN
jgi:hypothetical protein